MVTTCAPLSRIPKGPPQRQVYNQWQQNGIQNRQKLVEKLLLSTDRADALFNMHHNKLAASINQPFPLPRQHTVV